MRIRKKGETDVEKKSENRLGSWLGLGGLTPAQEAEGLMALSAVTAPFGVYLTAAEAQEVAESHQASLQKARRVEFDRGPVELLARTFCGSIHLSREDWAGALETLTELFYQCKNETWDRVGDEELADLLFRAFEGCCRGSFELLESEVVPRLGRYMRAGKDPEAFTLPEEIDRWST